MKIGKKRENNLEEAIRVGKPARNQSKKTSTLIIIVIITALLISWVTLMSKKATDTVTVIMTSQAIYKNQQITEEMIEPYDMIKAEFEKYAVNKTNGQKTRRIMTWDEKDKIIGSFAAYPMQASCPVEYRSLYKSRIDNSDSVLYGFPGKEIVSLDIANSDLKTFKTFLQPGDRINISAIYTDSENVSVTDSYGITSKEKVTTYRTEPVFQDIILADLLNNNGDSILDIYEDYNNKTVAQQAALDKNTAFQDSVEPKSILVALTPEEKELYYYYLSKSGVTFRMSLPQRVE